MSANIFLEAATGLVAIQGTNSADSVHLSSHDGTVFVTVSSSTGADTVIEEASFSRSEVAGVVFRGFEGNDSFINDTTLSTTAFGGDGDDYLEGGGGSDQFYGGAGADVLVGYAGDDALAGGLGNDSLFGMTGQDGLRGGYDDDLLYGGSGADRLQGGSGINTLDPRSDGPLADVTAPYFSQKIEDYVALSQQLFQISAFGLSDLERQVIDRTNLRRINHGLRALQINSQLLDAAQVHANNMAAYNTMSHTLTGANYPTLASRLNYAGYAYRKAGENIAYNYATAQAVVRAWMLSPGHRANILDPAFTQIGVGIAYNSQGEAYYCQVFGKPA